MIRKTMLAALAVLGLAAGPAPAQEDARDLARISNYLNATQTLEGSFIQIDADAVVSEGAFWLRRPGRMRFEYAPPNPALVISDGTWVAVVDQRDGKADRYPLRDTPLHLLLRENVDLRREGAVRQIDRSGGQLAVTAVDPANPGAGHITMIFDNDPLALRQWVVTDPQGRTTTVALRETRSNVAIPNEKFAITDFR